MQLSPESLRWIHQTSRRCRRDGIFFSSSSFSFPLIFPVSFSKALFTSDTSLWVLLLSNSYYGYTGSFDLSKKSQTKSTQETKPVVKQVSWVVFLGFFFHFIFYFFAKSPSIISRHSFLGIFKAFFPLRLTNTFFRAQSFCFSPPLNSSRPNYSRQQWLPVGSNLPCGFFRPSTCPLLPSIQPRPPCCRREGQAAVILLSSSEAGGAHSLYYHQC